MNAPFTVRTDQDALTMSVPAPVSALSWAILNGGFCYADHVINHRVRGGDARFCAQPARWLEEAALGLGLRGVVVAMATAVEMKNLVHAALSGGGF
jgi:adenosylcobinamide amidohydrolase